MSNTLPKWNLKDLYDNSTDPNIKKDIAIIKQKVINFKEKYSHLNINQYTEKMMLEAVEEYELISEMTSKISSFAGLQYYSDLNNEDYKFLYQFAQEELTPILSELTFFSLFLSKIDEADIKKLIAKESKLKKYEYFFEIARQFQKHQLSEELEKYISQKSVTGKNAWVRLYDETLAAMIFDFDNEQLPLEAITHKMGDKDPQIRKKAAYCLSKELSNNINLFTTITNVLAKDKSIDDQWRKFEFCQSSRNLNNQIEDNVVDALIDSVVESYKDISHKYYQLKAKKLGLERLEYWDRNAPLEIDTDASITWEQAKEIVLNAYNEFSPTLSEIGKKFFDNNWIDADVYIGKTSGAFAHPCIPSVHPYILVNFKGKRRDVMTLAHELGHGIHQYLAKEQGYLLADTPLTLAETASVFGEMLTFRYLLNNAKTVDEKKSLLSSKIDDMLNTVVRQIAFYRFEKNVHELRMQGELSSDDLNHIWNRTQKEALGEYVNLNEITNNYWAYISHFIHAPFYVYAYAFGDCLVNSLYSFYLKNKDGFEDKYIELLKAGGSKKYDTLLKPFNFDLKDKDFWKQGLSMIKSLIDEWEGLQ